MSLINFKDLPDTTTPITADNLNNNFEYLENLNNYSTDEIVVGKWIDGKPLYRKIINFGTLPNSTSKEVSSGLTNIFICNMYGFAYSDTTIINLPFSSYTNAVNNITLVYDYVNGSIKVQTGSDRSGFHSSYIVLEYTKITD